MFYIGNIWNGSNSLSFSESNSDIIYVTTHMGTTGAPDLYDACGAPYPYYPEWSYDIYVIKSTDGGQSWWNPLNITNTPNDVEDCFDEYGEALINRCDPAEQYPHAAQWATDDELYVLYQMPDWGSNLLGTLADEDFLNHISVHL